MVTSYQIFTFLHFFEILANSNIPKVAFNIQADSEVQRACKIFGSGPIEIN